MKELLIHFTVSRINNVPCAPDKKINGHEREVQGGYSCDSHLKYTLKTVASFQSVYNALKSK